MTAGTGIDHDAAAAAGPAGEESQERDKRRRGPAPPPSREEIRLRIEKGLTDGTLTIERMIADIYASQYAAELSLRQFGAMMDGLLSSGIGKRLLRKRGKLAEVAEEIEQEFDADSGGD